MKSVQGGCGSKTGLGNARLCTVHSIAWARTASGRCCGSWVVSYPSDEGCKLGGLRPRDCRFCDDTRMWRNEGVGFDASVVSDDASARDFSAAPHADVAGQDRP